MSGSPVARFDETVPPQRRARAEDLVDQEPAGLGLVDDAARPRVERRLELRGDELPVEVVLVVDGRDGEVDLRRPVGRVPAVGATHPLELLDEVPPARVVVGVGIGVEPTLEVRHDEHPAGEHEQRPLAVPRRGGRRAPRRRPRRSRRRSSASRGLRASRPNSMATPSVVSAWAGSRRSHGQSSVELAVVHGVTELVQHRLGPPLVGLDVAQDPHVALAVDVDAERVLALSFARVQVAAGEHGPDVEAEAVVGAKGERFEVGVVEEGVEVDRAADRRVLEEGVVEVPGPEVVDGRSRTARRGWRRAAPSTRRRVPRSPDRPRRGWRTVGPRRARWSRGRGRSGRGSRGGRAASFRSRASSRTRSATSPPTCFDASHAARRVAGVVARAQDVEDRVVVDALAVDLAAERVERGVDLRPRARRCGGEARRRSGAGRRRRGARRAGGRRAARTGPPSLRAARLRRRHPGRPAARAAPARFVPADRPPRATRGCWSPTRPRPSAVSSGRSLASRRATSRSASDTTAKSTGGPRNASCPRRSAVGRHA